MHIAQLSLSNFRNYRTLRVDLEPRPVVLFGDNGAGKTNLLEAVSLLLSGRGLRGVRYEELLRNGAEGGWAVAAKAVCPSGEVRLGTAWEPPAPGRSDASGTSRQVSVNGTLHKSSGILADYLRAVWLVPAMDRLFSAASSDRRRFLDRLVAAYDGDHGRRILLLERLLRERNKLLADYHSDKRWLDSIELQLAETAIACAAARAETVARLEAYIAAHKQAAAYRFFPWAGLKIEGELEAKIPQFPAVQIEDEYRRLLADSRNEDRAAGRTLHGAHRSDLLVAHGPKQMPARSCSTGEQKALLVGLMMAQARCLSAEFDGSPPLLLFDEVAAHLDEDRRHGLFEDIRELGAQAWLTGTDANLFEAIAEHGQIFAVKDAVLESL